MTIYTDKWNYQDIIKFHEIRLDKNNMTKITVKPEIFRKVPFVSNFWEYRDERFSASSQDYIGIKGEECRDRG